MRNDSPFVDELLQYGGQLGGKRLRPALLLLVGPGRGTDQPEHHTLAAVVEMIHTATLVHDDVLDEADMRRHLATVNSRWNNETSVLLGDYLFTHAFYLASTLDSTYACRRIGRSTNLVCEGELRQIGHRGNHALSEEEYFEIINGKTAELCACACHLGAKYAEADRTVGRTGWNNSDAAWAWRSRSPTICLDLVGDESATGKSLGTDLEKRQAHTAVDPCLPESVGSRTTRLGGPASRAVGPDMRQQVHAWLERTMPWRTPGRRPWSSPSRPRSNWRDFPPPPPRAVLLSLTEFVVNRSL